MMMSMGCIQARRCNSNDCPVGIATQNPSLTAGLVVAQKSTRVARYHAETIGAAMELLGAAGIATPADLRPWHIIRRVTDLEIRHYGEIVEYLEPDVLLGKELPKTFERAWHSSTSSSFSSVNEGAVAN